VFGLFRENRPGFGREETRDFAARLKMDRRVSEELPFRRKSISALFENLWAENGGF
jgi:hypothetical protein